MASEHRGWLGFIPKLPGWLIAFTTFVTTLVGFIELWQRGPRLLSLVLLAVGVVAGLLGCIYLAFKRRRSDVFPAYIWQYPRIRPWALAALGIIPTTALIGLGVHFYLQSRPPAKVIIAVADFDGEEPKKYRVTEIIVEKLRSASSTYDDVEVQYLAQVITAQAGSDIARAKGNERKASIVLWGWYAVTRERVWITANLEVLRRPMGFSLIQQNQSLNVTVAALESFTVQEELSGQMSYLTLMAVGAARLDALDYDKAIALFTAALDQPPASERMVDPGDIYGYRATAYMMKGDFGRALADIDAAILRSSDVVHFHAFRGSIHQARSDHDRALKDFNQAIDSALKHPHRDEKQRLSWVWPM